MTALPKLDTSDRRITVLDEDGTKITTQQATAAVMVAFTELRSKPEFGAQIDTYLIFGETVKVCKHKDSWVLVQADRDQYVGWVEENTLNFEPKPATHLVSASRTFFYPEPDLKTPHKGMRSMGSALTIADNTETRGTQYAITETGEAVISKHIRPIAEADQDYVQVAEGLLNTPYLWAGASAFGIDCSGLVKLAMYMCGQKVLRDSDMQAATIGIEIDPGANLENVKRGDLMFWRGHVAIVYGQNQQGIQQILHANGHTMNVTIEPMLEAVERIAYLYEKPIGVRRPG